MFLVKIDADLPVKMMNSLSGFLWATMSPLFFAVDSLCQCICVVEKKLDFFAVKT